MQLGYLRPFSFHIGPRAELRIAGVRHGVTEIRLSDGRLVHAMLHIKTVKADPNEPGAIELSYNLIAEVMAEPEVPIQAVHQTVQ
jgi:hypothetical protein